MICRCHGTKPESDRKGCPDRLCRRKSEETGSSGTYDRDGSCGRIKERLKKL